MPSSSRVEDTYESQNDQRLDDLHSKIRTIRGVRSGLSDPNLILILFYFKVTTDIHNDVEAQNLLLDESVRLPHIQLIYDALLLKCYLLE